MPWKLTSVSWNLQLNAWSPESALQIVRYFDRTEIYSRIGLVECHGNLQSYWTTAMSWKLTVVLAYCNAIETYSRIGILQCHGNLQSYCTTEMSWKLTVVLDHTSGLGVWGWRSDWSLDIAIWVWGADWSTMGIIWLTWNLQSYWTTEMPWKLRFVLDYYNVMETYSGIELS
jgi:hypothetical protein